MGCRERQWQRLHASSLWSPVLGDLFKGVAPLFFGDSVERETCGDVRPSLRTLPSLVHTRSVGCLFAVFAAHIVGHWGEVPILSLCPEATCGSVGCRTVKLQRRGTWISQRHFLSLSFSLKNDGEGPSRASPSTNKQTNKQTNKHSLNSWRCAFK